MECLAQIQKPQLTEKLNSKVLLCKVVALIVDHIVIDLDVA
jgi:hypothetical protein